MKFIKEKLSNGLRVIVSPMPSLESATLTVWVGVGSKNEEEKIGGISHFSEHIVFKGSEKRPTTKEISEAVDAIGGEFNAATSKEWTNFYIKARASDIEKSFDVLSDMVLNPLLKEEDIEKEKGVILEEMAMYEDLPMYKVGEVFENLIFEKSSLENDVIGTRESVSSIAKDDFIRYRKLHYHIENMLLTVSGGITEKQVMGLGEKYFGNINKENNIQNKKIEINQQKSKVRLVNKKIEQTHLVLGYLGNPMNHNDRYAEAILGNMLGGGMSSRLFSELREKRGLAYSVRTDSDHFVDTGYISTYAGVDPKKTEEAIKVILEEHNKISSSKHVISNSELEKVKSYIKGHLALSLENTSHVNDFVGEKEVLLGKFDTPDEVYKGIDQVTIEEVNRIAREFFKTDRLNLALIGPYNDEEKFRKILNEY